MRSTRTVLERCCSKALPGWLEPAEGASRKRQLRARAEIFRVFRSLDTYSAAREQLCSYCASRWWFKGSAGMRTCTFRRVRRSGPNVSRRPNGSAYRRFRFTHIPRITPPNPAYMCRLHVCQDREHHRLSTLDAADSVWVAANICAHACVGADNLPSAAFLTLENTSIP